MTEELNTTWPRQPLSDDEYDFGTHPTGGFYFAKKNEHYKHKSAALDYSGNDVTVRTDEKTAQPQRHDETRNIDEKKGHSYSFKESTKLILI